MISKTISKIGFLEFVEIKRYKIKSSSQILIRVYTIYSKRFNIKKFND